jgi:inosine-uridine nucleoside N-ribohydrolase
MFRRTHPDYADLPEGWRLYRQLLAKQPDHSVSICSVGFINALAQLLQSEADEHSPLNGVELVRQKVKAIYVMGGVLANANEPDYNLGLGIEFAQTFFQLWPQEVQMYFSPGDVGNGIDYPIDQVLEDYAWDKNHPIRQIYQNYPCDVGQRMWDPLVVIQAVEGNELFTLSEPCQVNITPEAVVVFTPSEKGNCRYQLPGTPEWNQQILQKIRETSFEK